MNYFGIRRHFHISSKLVSLRPKTRIRFIYAHIFVYSFSNDEKLRGENFIEKRNEITATTKHRAAENFNGIRIVSMEKTMRTHMHLNIAET